MKTRYAIYKNELYQDLSEDNTTPHLVTFNNLIAKPLLNHYSDFNFRYLSRDVTKSQIVTWFLIKYSTTLVLSVALLAIVVK